jgi:aflatoxin B1 aldehyde reductase
MTLTNYILGTMNIKYPYSSNKDQSIESYQEIINYYIENYENPILDTAYYYGNGETEKILGEIVKDMRDDIKIATKANPWFDNDFTNGKYGQLSKENLQRQLNTSLQNLKKKDVEYFYLHCYDYETDLKETLETCDLLWRTEKFNYLGISNFSLLQMEEVMDICEKNGILKPAYYQGMYNVICRKVEEIFPFLEENRMEFWGYNPLAGGLLTGKYTKNNEELLESEVKISSVTKKFMDNEYDKKNSRFSDDNKIYKNIFWKPELVKIAYEFSKEGDSIKKSYEWLQYNSNLRKTDKIIMGVSTLDQIKNNTISLNKPLYVYDIEKKNEWDKEYERIKENSPNYYY